MVAIASPLMPSLTSTVLCPCGVKTYIEVIATGVEFSAAHVRWINPADVRSCYPMPNLDVIAFMTGAWSDPDAILTRAARGFAFTYGQF